VHFLEQATLLILFFKNKNIKAIQFFSFFWGEGEAAGGYMAVKTRSMQREYKK